MSKVQLKLAAVLVALVGIVSLASGVLAERGLRERQLQALERSLVERARLVTEWISVAQGNRPSSALQALAMRASRAADARVTLIARDGTVLADSEVAASEVAAMENHRDRPEVAAALAGRTGRATRLSATVAQPFLYLAVPAPPESGAVVRLAVDLALIEQEASALRRTLWWAGAVCLACVLLFAPILSGYLTRPLRELRQVLEALTSGALEERAAPGGQDELGEIAAAVNELAHQLRRRIDEVGAENERLQAVLQGMVEGVLVQDRSGRVVLANPRIRELFGAWGEVVGRPALEVIRRADVDAALALAAESEVAVVCELSLGDRALQMHAVRFPAAGDLLGTVAVFHDLTEIRRLEQVRQEFVANVSHELKTPLTAIRGFAETLLSSSVPEEQRQGYLEVIRRHADRLGALIDDLLELSRIEGRRDPVEAAEVGVADVARTVLRDMAPRLEARQLTARLDAACDGRAIADRRAVEQILLNLLENAAKYTEPGGRIRVGVAEEGDRVRIEVADNGIGIPEADRPRVFERFYRVEKARSRDLGGTGLGLAIVKHLVQAMRGEVFLESEDGKGTTFTISLPRCEDGPANVTFS